MQTVKNAVIAVAGLGSRLGHGIPKCMLEIEGRTLLSRLIDLVQKHVSQIHVIVGYREDLVVKHCASLHKNVILVRNPEFRETNTAYSLFLGARHLQGKTIFLDGDLLIAPDSFEAFMRRANDVELLLGVTPANSEQGVFAHIQERDDESSTLLVTELTRGGQSKYEWANVFCGPSDVLPGTRNGYVFEELSKRLPLPGQIIQLREVDTEQDLILLKQFAKDLRV